MGDAWIVECSYRQLSDRTIDSRRRTLAQLDYWMREYHHDVLDSDAVKAFLVYLHDARPGGRWGQASHKAGRDSRPSTIWTYWTTLRSWCRWMSSEGHTDGYLMDGIKAPKKTVDQIVPFSQAQIRALAQAAKLSDNPARDEAVVAVLIDTGMRAAELCAMRIADVDLAGHKLWIARGKGDKGRAVYIGLSAARAITRYLRKRTADMDEPLIMSERGGRMTTSGLGQLVERLGRKARVQGVRCSPHTFRHSMAVMFLRNGGHVFALKEILGHTTLHMTNRYVLIAQADAQAQHVLHSPADAVFRSR
ncbi:MAG TPA: tyrosine-type recombinase/integrase [Armatimonadota bacterium]|jgi:site-specific recombinase XerD